MIRTPNGVMLSSKEFETLPDYSCTIPSLTTIGKQWRRRQPYQIGPGIKNEYLLGEYTESSKPGKVNIEWTKILLPEGYVPMELRGI